MSVCAGSCFADLSHGDAETGADGDGGHNSDEGGAGGGEDSGIDDRGGDRGEGSDSAGGRSNSECGGGNNGMGTGSAAAATAGATVGAAHPVASTEPAIGQQRQQPSDILEGIAPQGIRMISKDSRHFKSP